MKIIFLLLFVLITSCTKQPNKLALINSYNISGNFNKHLGIALSIYQLPEYNFIKEVFTDINGDFKITGIVPGKYQVYFNENNCIYSPDSEVITVTDHNIILNPKSKRTQLSDVAVDWDEIDKVPLGGLKDSEIILPNGRTLEQQNLIDGYTPPMKK